MQIQVNVNKLNAITRDYINEDEYNVHKVNYEFSEEYTNDLVKVALFTKDGKTYKVIITNNQCDIPVEILAEKGTFILGVYAYTVENEELKLRYSPTPIKLFVSWGSYIPDSQTENSEPITPSELEQYQQALQDGLNEVNDKIDVMDAAIAEVNNIDIDATKVDNVTTITINKKDGTIEEVSILDGQNGQDGKDGKDGKDGITGRDGVSPVITETKTQNGYDISITDINGTNTISLLNGQNGQDGATGATGKGISSITKTGTSGLVDTYTIQYTTGNPTTYTVTNGANGQNRSKWF